ncbi:hypothetical protein XENORESO_005442 [Xenotaenia resolanae]|uniref:Uncharacterized protein n=1 Tax=Xenotaenia resolanae TaxID=208358 RepID=A0ABV0WF60_9TELE
MAFTCIALHQVPRDPKALYTTICHPPIHTLTEVDCIDRDEAAIHRSHRVLLPPSAGKVGEVSCPRTRLRQSRDSNQQPTGYRTNLYQCRHRRPGYTVIHI